MIVLTAAILLMVLGLGALIFSGVKRVGDEPYCAKCRFELTGVPHAERCPECGTRLNHQASKIIGKRNQKAFRLGLILILISLPFFLLRYSQTKYTTDQHKPLWWLRAEYTFVHQNDWRYFNELKRRLDAATLTTAREKAIAAIVLDQADAFNGQPHIRDTVLSAYRHLSLDERSEHIGALLQKWVDEGLNTQSLAYMNFGSYLHQTSNEIAIEPLVKFLESQRATLTAESTWFDIRQKLKPDLLGLMQVWWQANGPGTPIGFQDRIRGEPIGYYVISPTVVSKGESFEFRIGPRFAGLVYETPGWSHARVNEIRFNGEPLEIEYPIESSFPLNDPALIKQYSLDLSALETGTYDMEIDTQMLGSPNALPSESEWEAANKSTIKRMMKVMPSESDVEAYWASDEVMQAAHDAVSVRRLNIVPIELDETTYNIWDLSISITESPVFFCHDIYLDQGDQTWKLDQIYVREGVSDSFETHTRYYATMERYARQADPPVIRTPIPGEPVMIRLIPKPDLSYNLYQQVWAREVLLGTFIPEKGPGDE